MATKKEPIHWTYQGKSVKTLADTPEGSIGIIYMVKNLTNGKFYVGRKSFISKRKKRLTPKEKALPGNSRKTFKIEETETKWQTYTGSCKPLNEDIKNGDTYVKEIVRFCFNKKQLTYYELKAIICTDCLERADCYNGNVAGKIFPKDLVN